MDPNTRQGKRTPVTLKIKFKSETLEQFIERYAVDVSQGGIFIRTKEPLAVGTQMRFEFQLRDASPLIAGEGTVVWTRENDPSRPAIAPGMGVRFDRLAEGSQSVLERILSEKAKQAPSRTAPTTTKQPMFTDTPTRVAPLPVQDALLGAERKRLDSFGGEQGTPLPRPVPFHSDADDFDERAFEEATKVRALDELIAQTADSDAAASLRQPRADSTLADPPRAESLSDKPEVDRDSAPVLPSPPEPSRPQPRMLDATPSPRAEPAPDKTPEPARTRLGMEPAKVTTSQQMPAAVPAAASTAKDKAPSRPSGARAAAAAPEAKPVSQPPAKKSSAAAVVIIALLVVAAGAAGVWFFVLRDKAAESVANRGAGSGSAVADLGSPVADAAVHSGDGSGSGSAAVAAVDAAPAVPPAELVDTEITASIKTATIEILGTDQTGPAPLTAKLEKDKAYTARVQAPGFAAVEIELKGGVKPPTVNLEAKPRVISVATTPPGAAILIDGYNTGKTTPSTVTLSKAQAARKSVRIGFRKSGYRGMERVIDQSKYTEDASELIASLDEAMTEQQIRRPPPPPPPVDAGTTAGSATTATGSGSAGTTTGSGSGSGTTTGTTAGSGSAKPPAGAGSGSGSGSTLRDGPKPGLTPDPGEPEPDFMNKLK